jgi:hypothetical protein
MGRTLRRGGLGSTRLRKADAFMRLDRLDLLTEMLRCVERRIGINVTGRLDCTLSSAARY